jgi:hypothetical protein
MKASLKKTQGIGLRTIAGPRKRRVLRQSFSVGSWLLKGKAENKAGVVKGGWA